MKKSRVVIYSTVVVILLLVASFFIPITSSNAVTIEANFYNVLDQINHPANWLKWRSSLNKKNASLSNTQIHIDSASNAFSIKAQDAIYVIKRITPVSFGVEEKLKDASKSFAIGIEPTKFPKKTNVITLQEVSLFNYLFNRNNEATRTVNDLKFFMEDPVSYYGYPLTVQPVVDTIVLVTEKKVSNDVWRSMVAKMYDDIYSKIAQNNLHQLQPKIISFRKNSDNTTQIRVGIPVNEAVSVDGNIECLKMPKGKMFV